VHLICFAHQHAIFVPQNASADVSCGQFV